jgi:farnesyl diphosphate synthase
MKTGALLAAACEAGAVLGQAKPEARIALQTYGLAFQIADDLLDAEGDAKLAGKRVGKDKTRGKATLIAKLGTAEARKRLVAYAAEAESALSAFGPRAAMLKAAARFVAARQH